MKLFPFDAALSSRALFARSCRLYRIGLLKALPFSALWVAMYAFLRLGKDIWPASLHPYYLQTAMIIGVLILPVMAMVVVAYDKTGREDNPSVFSITLDTCRRILSFFGVFISMLLIPALVAGLLLGLYLLFLKYQLPDIWLCFYPILACLILYLAFVHNLMAPFLNLSDHLDANTSIEHGQQLVKPYYGLTLIYGLYSVLIVLFIMMLPFLVNYYWPHLGVAQWVLETSSALLLMVVSPWSFAFLLTYKFQLQSLFKTAQQNISS